MKKIILMVLLVLVLNSLFAFTLADEGHIVKLTKIDGRIGEISQDFEVADWDRDTTYRISALFKTEDAAVESRRTFGLRINWTYGDFSVGEGEHGGWWQGEDIDAVGMENIHVSIEGSSEGSTVRHAIGNLFVINTSFGALMQSAANWLPLSWEFRLPEDVNMMRIALYNHSVSDGSTSYWIDFKLVDTNNPDVNLIQNPNFNEFDEDSELKHWFYSGHEDGFDLITK